MTRQEEEKLRMKREMVENYRKAGIYPDNPRTRQDALEHLKLVPSDTRDLTGRLFGDPIPGDPRRPWLGGNHERI